MMESNPRNVEYGNFDILWKGALKALLEEDGKNTVSQDSRTPNRRTHEKSQQETDSSPNAFTQDSPLKPVKRKTKAARIESESEDDDVDDDVAALLDSDSDLEIVEEQWRPPRTPKNIRSEELQRYYLSQLNETDEQSELTMNTESPAVFKVPQLTADFQFKAPACKLPLNPKYFESRRRGLRSRSKKVNSKSSQLNGSNSSSQRNSVQRDDSNHSNSNCSQPDTSLRSVPVSIEEELIGEGGVWSSDEEMEYEQRENGALIETEAQCSDEGGDDSDLDGELEQSFINDQTIMSQQLSQDSMQGVYLQSIRPGW